MSMEYTKAQAEKILCPVVSRPGEHVNCRTTQCMAWAWSSQMPTMVLVTDMPKEIPAHIDDLARPGDGWNVDLDNNAWLGSDGRIKRSTDDGVDAKYIAWSGYKTKIRWIKPWGDDRLGGCELCTAKVADVDVSN